MVIALANGRVLTDGGLVEGHAVLVEGERILEVVPQGDARVRAARRHDLGGALLLPGFVDVQVNGGGGVLFNDAPTVEAIAAIGAAHRRFGTAAFLPTLISDERDVIERGMRAADEAIERGVPGILGIHVEGPFINVEKRGTHDAQKIRGLGEDELALLSRRGRGRTLVTLAPETTTPAAIRRLASAGVVLSAGHTNATYEQIGAALDNGVTGITHLFNAMSPLGTRAPGVVGAALADDRCWCGIIADGKHVHPAVLRIAVAAKRRDRFMLVTDAMPCVGVDGDEFVLQGKRIRVVDGVCVDDGGVLSGSALDMATAVRNAVNQLGLPLEEAVRMASRNPAEFLGLGGELGRIAPGYRASFVVADESLRVRETWIDGRP